MRQCLVSSSPPNRDLAFRPAAAQSRNSSYTQAASCRLAARATQSELSFSPHSPVSLPKQRNPARKVVGERDSRRREVSRINAISRRRQIYENFMENSPRATASTTAAGGYSSRALQRENEREWFPLFETNFATCCGDEDEDDGDDDAWKCNEPQSRGRESSKLGETTRSRAQREREGECEWERKSSLQKSRQVEVPRIRSDARAPNRVSPMREWAAVCTCMCVWVCADACRRRRHAKQARVRRPACHFIQASVWRTSEGRVRLARSRFRRRVADCR